MFHAKGAKQKNAKHTKDIFSLCSFCFLCVKQSFFVLASILLPF